jgi:hypothetical protein
MVPLSVDLGELVALTVLLAVAFLPGLVAAALWSPFLLADRLRALFRLLPPRGRLAPSYLVLAVGGGLPYVVGGLWGLSRDDAGGAAAANALLDVLLTVSLAYVLVGPVLAAAVLPGLGFDWDPTDYGTGTWALLVGGTAWYAVLLSAPLFAMAVVAAFPG